MHRLFFHRKRWIILAFSFVALFIANWLELFLQRKSNIIGGGINRAFLFLLINLHVILIAILLYIIVKQSIKLVIERRRKTPGSGFKQNLFFAFMFFSVIPSFFVFFTAGKFITASIDKWFQVQIGQGLQSGLKLHEALTVKERALLQDSDSASGNIKMYRWNTREQASLRTLLMQEIAIWRSYRVLNDRTMKSLRVSFLNKLNAVGLGEDKTFDFYGSLYRVKYDSDGYTLMVYRYPEAIRVPLVQLQNSLDDVMELKSMQTSIYNSYFFTFILVVLLILLLSIWCAFYLAKGISTPIQDLLQATEKIRKGNWNVSVNDTGQNDLKPLAIGFNEMTKAVKLAHEELENRNKEMFTILENINDSVFYVNRFGRIININQAAKKLISTLTRVDQLKQRKITFLPEQIRSTFFSLVREFFESGKKQFSKEITITINYEHKVLMVHLTEMDMMRNAVNMLDQGILLVIQDFTEIVKLSRAKAWQEAAKQVAHEIKNPLTPIQLATQRLQRKYHNFFAAEPAFADCTETILAHVKIIKDLASHFADFASLPVPNIERVDLNEIIKESVRLYELSYPQILFSFQSSHDEVVTKTDREKIKQVLVNLLDNSVRELLTERSIAINKEISISVKLDNQRNSISVMVVDNGPGIEYAVREKLFMPYVSTHKKNMGLGLAIVHDIMKQLDGGIRLVPTTTGAVFEITLPYL